MTAAEILNWINGAEVRANGGGTFTKLEPATGAPLAAVTRSLAPDIESAIAAARNAQPSWAARPPVERGRILFDVAIALREHRTTLADSVGRETGRPASGGAGEVDSAVASGLFFAGEGQRLFARTLPSSDADRHVYQVRLPMGVAGLIVPANTPLANVANKVFPALICGNAVVLKAAEDAPLSADAFARIAHESGLPRGVLNVVQGLGSEAGAPLVDASVDVISFTGSTAVGRQIAAKAGESLVKTSLELGGKNALVVCDDADLENAVKWSLLSSFSNAGQRCASSSRIIAFDAIYDRFRAALVERTKALRVGVSDSDDLGPVISERHLERLIQSVERARAEGTTVLCGGSRLQDPAHASGYYLAPTVLDGMSVDAHVSQEELFGPITCLYRVRNLEEAIALTNRSRYGLTSAIHTANVHRAMEFVRRSRAGVTTVNRGTYGSEPHMPFGGMGQSGNGTREPGTEALDVYSQLKNVHIGFDSRLA